VCNFQRSIFGRAVGNHQGTTPLKVVDGCSILNAAPVPGPVDRGGPLSRWGVSRRDVKSAPEIAKVTTANTMKATRGAGAGELRTAVLVSGRSQEQLNRRPVVQPDRVPPTPSQSAGLYTTHGAEWAVIWGLLVFFTCTNRASFAALSGDDNSLSIALDHDHRNRLKPLFFGLGSGSRMRWNGL
jgi:hypothetical protein